jgi:hypothetical protein
MIRQMTQPCSLSPLHCWCGVRYLLSGGLGEVVVAGEGMQGNDVDSPAELLGWRPPTAEQAGFDYDGPVLPRLRGREPQVDVLRGQLNALGAGRGSVVLVTGPAGAGKATLLSEAASLAPDMGVRVFCGGGDPAARAVPLGAVLDALVSAEDSPVDPARLHDLSRSPDQRL